MSAVTTPPHTPTTHYPLRNTPVPFCSSRVPRQIRTVAHLLCHFPPKCSTGQIGMAHFGTQWHSSQENRPLHSAPGRSRTPIVGMTSVGRPAAGSRPLHVLAFRFELLQGSAAAARSQLGQPDARLVHRHYGKRHQRLVHRIDGRRDHRAQDKGDDYREPPVLRQHRWSDDPDPGQEETMTTGVSKIRPIQKSSVIMRLA